MPAAPSPARAFFGAWVIRAAFVLAIFGWGIGFYGPPIFLHAVVERTAWPLVTVSSAMTLHFLFGAIVVVNLPRAYRRFGVPATIVTGACIASVGAVGSAERLQRHGSSSPRRSRAAPAGSRWAPWLSMR